MRRHPVDAWLSEWLALALYVQLPLVEEKPSTAGYLGGQFEGAALRLGSYRRAAGEGIWILDLIERPAPEGIANQASG